jgi:histone demethylase JARID1
MEPKFALGSIRTEVPREFPKSKQANRLFGLEHCPVFYPTIDEFKEPMKYFESIGSKLKPFGIGKIVPPVGWKPPFVLDTDVGFPLPFSLSHLIPSLFPPFFFLPLVLLP